MSSKTNSGSDDQNRIPEEILADLREAGVTEAFIEVITTPASEAGVARNSARQEVLKYMDWMNEGDDIGDYLHYGGHFFQSLQDHREHEQIPGHADSTNRELLNYIFNDDGSDELAVTPL